MAWEYSDKTKLLFMNAVTGDKDSHFGEIEDADGVGEHGSIACGDAMKFMFRVKRHEDPLKDVIVEAKYATFGCTSAIAASEALCALIEQGEYTPIQALKIDNQDIVKFLEGLPSQKIHCSVMGAEALEAAVVNWAQNRGVDLAAQGVEILEHGEDESRIVCQCFTVTEAQLKRKIVELNLHSLEEVENALKAGSACGSCRHAPGGIQDLLDLQWGEERDGGEVASLSADTFVGIDGSKLSAYQLSKRIESVLDSDVRPILQADGGDIDLVDIKGNLVYVELVGACAGCHGADATLGLIVERNLQKKVCKDLTIISI